MTKMIVTAIKTTAAFNRFLIIHTHIHTIPTTYLYNLLDR